MDGVKKSKKQLKVLKLPDKSKQFRRDCYLSMVQCSQQNQRADRCVKKGAYKSLCTSKTKLLSSGVIDIHLNPLGSSGCPKIDIS